MNIMNTMKSTLTILALSATAAGAFQAAPISQRSSSALAMGGFLEGRGQKITIREDEDNAMWFGDEPAGGKKAAPKKPEPKKPVKAEAKKGAIKFPWDK